MIVIKNNVEVFRKELDISQEKLARMCEVSRQTISSLENYRYAPSIFLAFKISKIFNKKIEEIFIYEEEENAKSKS